MDNINNKFNKMYHGNYTMVYNYVRKIIFNDDNLIDDIVSETFLKAYKYFDKFDETKSKEITWLCTIAKNNFIDHCRKMKNRKTVSIDKPITGEMTITDFLKSNVRTPEQIFDNNTIKNDVLLAISMIKKPHIKKVVELFFINELTLNEISKKLSIPVNTIKVYIFRSRKILQVLLKKYEVILYE